MKVRINGEDTQFADNCSLNEALQQFNLTPQSYVIELNGIIIHKENFMETILKDGDSLEVIRFVGGG